MSEVHYIEWHIVPFRRDRLVAIWTPALDRALAYGAKAAFLTRNEDDTLHLRQVTVWDSRADHERWKERYRWFFEAMAELQDALPGKPLEG